MTHLTQVVQHNSPSGRTFEAWTIYSPKRKQECVLSHFYPHTEDDDQRRMEYWYFTEELLMLGYHLGYYYKAESGREVFYVTE